MKISSQFSVFLLTILAGCGTSKDFTASWQGSSVGIESYKSGSNLPELYDSETKIIYGVTNDAENLYVFIKINEEETQRSVMQNGLELMIDTLGKKYANYTLEYPIYTAPPTFEQENQKPESKKGERPSAPSPEEMNKRLEGASMNLIGFMYHENGEVNPVNDNGIEAYMNLSESGILTFHAVIPFYTFLSDYEYAVNSEKVISLGVYIEASKMGGPPEGSEERPAMQGDGMSGPPGGGPGGMGGPGGGPGGPPPGGEGGPGGLEGSTSPSDKELWVRFDLAKKEL